MTVKSIGLGLILEEKKKWCGGLFADDVVLIAPSAKNLEKLLKKVHRWNSY